jgi:hypothetical protein
MGYKFLGYAVWQGTKWYLRRRRVDMNTGKKVAIVGAAGALVAGAVAAGRQAASSGDA